MLEYDVAVGFHQGERKEMEDYHNLDYNFQGSDAIFGGVYDGHHGFQVAEYVTINLPKVFADVDVGRFDCSNSFIKTYQVVSQRVNLLQFPGGVCLANFIIYGEKIFFANAGDCRILLIGDNEVYHLSNDHRPGNLLERRRVQSMGGRIERNRIITEEGSIGFTRGIGDRQFHRHGLIATPHIGSVGIQATDKMLIVATDGIFEELDSFEIAEIAQRMRNASDSARHIIQAALHSGSQDNLTVIVAKFSH